MNVSIQRFFLIAIGFLFCLLGCTRDRAHMLMPDHISHPTEAMESTDIKTSFEHNVLPILTARCALAGCHVADGPHGLDFRTYASFIAGGEHGSVFIPGNAEESEVVEEIVAGRMPPLGPPLTDAEIQVFVDWINQQEPQDDTVPHDDDHGEEEDAHADMDDEHDEDMDDDHEDIDEGHDEHDDDDNGHDDDDHDDHDDDN